MNAIKKYHHWCSAWRTEVQGWSQGHQRARCHEWQERMGETWTWASKGTGGEKRMHIGSWIRSLGGDLRAYERGKGVRIMCLSQSHWVWDACISSKWRQMATGPLIRWVNVWKYLFYMFSLTWPSDNPDCPTQNSYIPHWPLAALLFFKEV